MHQSFAGRKNKIRTVQPRSHDASRQPWIRWLTSMVPLYQNDFAAAVVSLMLAHPMANRRMPSLAGLTFEFEACEPLLHVRCGLRPDPDRKMGFLSPEDP